MKTTNAKLNRLITIFSNNAEAKGLFFRSAAFPYKPWPTAVPMMDTGRDIILNDKAKKPAFALPINKAKIIGAECKLRALNKTSQVENIGNRLYLLNDAYTRSHDTLEILLNFLFKSNR